jgi:hypothetical protein
MSKAISSPRTTLELVRSLNCTRSGTRKLFKLRSSFSLLSSKDRISQHKQGPLTQTKSHPRTTPSSPEHLSPTLLPMSSTSSMTTDFEKQSNSSTSLTHPSVSMLSRLLTLTFHVFQAQAQNCRQIPSIRSRMMLSTSLTLPHYKFYSSQSPAVEEQHSQRQSLRN